MINIPVSAHEGPGAAFDSSNHPRRWPGVIVKFTPQIFPKPRIIYVNSGRIYPLTRLPALQIKLGHLPPIVQAMIMQSIGGVQ